LNRVVQYYGDIPTRKLRIFLYFGGAKTETQWYWPPAVGSLGMVSVHELRRE
jgi:hypothetical protein